MTTLQVMVRRLVRAPAFLVCCAAGIALAALDAAAADDSGQGDLRQMIEQQSKQIDVLAQEIARLNLLLEARLPTANGLAPSPAETAETAPAPAAGGPVHIVTKGETLTAIAKRYKITVPELLKVNKITDVRKLQIGQTLALPPNAKLPASPAPAPQ
jgi:LysM repeat protein